MGARTLDPGTTWRYVNVRRLISMIELSLESGLAWLVFEPNTPSLQAAVEREIRAFLLGRGSAARWTARRRPTR